MASTIRTHVLFDSARCPKALRSFGIGVLPATRWTGSYGWMPEEADARFAAQMFAMDRSEPTDKEWDAIAVDREWEEAYYELAALDTPSMCGCCGRSSDFVSAEGLCPPCEIALETAQEDSSMGSLYLAATGRRATY